MESFRTQLQRGRAGLQSRLAGMKAGDTFEIPSTGATAQVVEGTYKDNAANRKSTPEHPNGRVGKTYKTIRIIANSQKGANGLTVNGRPISRARKTISQSQASRAFNAYWNRKIREGKAKGPAFEKAAERAKARDLAYGRPEKLVNDSRYKARGYSPLAGKTRLVGPGPWEFQGVDFGPKRYNAVARPTMGNRRTAADKLGRAVLNPATGRTRKTYKGTGEQINIIDNLVANARQRLAADIAAGRKKAGNPAARARAAAGRANFAARRAQGLAAADARREAFQGIGNFLDQQGGYYY